MTPEQLYSEAHWLYEKLFNRMLLTNSLTPEAKRLRHILERVYQRKQRRKRKVIVKDYPPKYLSHWNY